MDTQPSSAYHSLPVRLFNRVARGLHVPPAAISEEALVAAARRETGLERFGDESFRPGLRRLVEAIENEADLNPFGRHFAPKPLVRSLKNRLWANACFEAHPEISTRPLAAPIVIVGPARSGTTRLQRMLAADERLVHLKCWEGFNPAPRAVARDAGREVRRGEIVKAMRMRRRFYPGADIAHPMDADAAEEEILLLNQSFGGLSPLAFYPAAGYHRWFVGADRRGAYRHMANLMRLVSWSRGDSPDKPWVMKTPQHMLDLDALLETFPDARLVFIHRDPLKTVASTLSLGWHHAVQNTDLPCRARVREVWLDLCERMARRCIAVREGLPAARQLDVYYGDMNRDWRGVMRRVYGHCGLELVPSAERAMADWLARSERENRHGGHRYAFEDYGTSRGEVDERMRFYRDRYSIPGEETTCHPKS